MRNLIAVAAIIFCSIFSSCSSSKGGMDVDEKDGVTTKTFYDSKENVQAVIISDNNGTIVAVPNESVNRKRKMSDEEYKCLKKCKKSDGGYDMNCVLLCPVTKQYQIFVR